MFKHNVYGNTSTSFLVLLVSGMEVPTMSRLSLYLLSYLLTYFLKLRLVIRNTI